MHRLSKALATASSLIVTRPRAENPRRTDRDLYVTTRHSIDGEDREDDGRDARVHPRGGR